MATALIAGLERDARRAAGRGPVARPAHARIARRLRASSSTARACSRSRATTTSASPAIPRSSPRRATARRAGASARAHRISSAATSRRTRRSSAELAAFVAPCGGARALTFSTGYLANLAILTALAGRDDAVFADRLNHACLNDGALLVARAARALSACATSRRSRRASRRRRASRKLIATDAVFSMDGDLAPLPRAARARGAHDAWLVVDDAHGFGVLGEGRGTLAHFGLARDRIVVHGHARQGGGRERARSCAAHPAVIETLVQTARPYIYTTAAPPMLAAPLRASLVRSFATSARRARLAPRSRACEPALIGCRGDCSLRRRRSSRSSSATNDAAMALSARLWSQRVFGAGDRPPTVPPGTARLRISLSAAHVDADVDALVAGTACSMLTDARLGDSCTSRSVGDGPPLVLLHGWAMHGGLFAPIVPSLARQHRVHAVDLPGHGYSDPVAAVDARRGRRRRSSAAFANAGALSRARLVARRRGRAALGASRPSRIARLVLVRRRRASSRRDDWPHAMTDETLARFGDELRVACSPRCSASSRCRCRAATTGARRSRRCAQQLFARGEPSRPRWRHALASLRATDLRDDVAPHPPADARRHRRSRHADAAGSRRLAARTRCRTRACMHSRAPRTRRSCRTATHSSTCACRSSTPADPRFPAARSARRRPARGAARVRPRGGELRRGRRPAARGRRADGVAPRRREARADAGSSTRDAAPARRSRRARGALSGRARSSARLRAADGRRGTRAGPARPLAVAAPAGADRARSRRAAPPFVLRRPATRCRSPASRSTSCGATSRCSGSTTCRARSPRCGAC